MPAQFFSGVARVALIFAFCISGATAQDESAESLSQNETSEDYIPTDLDDALEYLKSTLPPDDLEFLRTATESDIAGLHFGFGMGLRNGWGLWAGSRLAQWFNQEGIEHPDDMSGIIITSLVRDLRGEPRLFEEQVASVLSHK